MFMLNQISESESEEYAQYMCIIDTINLSAI